MTITRSTAVGRRYRPYFWEEFASEPAARPQGDHRRSLPPWAERGLRALRDGLGREPGTVPAMRFLHRVELTDDDRHSEALPLSYRAEHAALTLFGFHQIGAAQPVHRPGIGLGAACRALRGGPLSEPAAQRRLTAAATAQDLEELVQHLRGLVPVLRQADTGLDYTRLYRDLNDWLTPRHGRVLRAWGLQYTEPPAAMAEVADVVPHSRLAVPYWAAIDPQTAGTGAELAALRSGVGREAGTVPAMWTFHRTRMSTELRARGALTRDLLAEHVALTLFGVHQHGRRTSMHMLGVSPGTAWRMLLAKDSSADRPSSERRLGALLTSLDAEELAHHLRGLVSLLRSKDIGLDYNALTTALRDWDNPTRPDEQSRIRSRWDWDFRAETQSARD